MAALRGFDTMPSWPGLPARATRIGVVVHDDPDRGIGLMPSAATRRRSGNDSLQARLAFAAGKFLCASVAGDTNMLPPVTGAE
jgi:hypothetical protein